MEQDIGEMATSFLRRLEAYDFTGARTMCTDAATVWHNDASGEQTVGAVLEHFESFAATANSLQFDVVRQFKNSNEVLQQHVLRLSMADGSCSEVHAAVYFRFEHGLIDRIEEFMYSVPADQVPQFAPSHDH
ncbi:nuclear transport factor 2 family protein [Mycobacterium decipiens]|uniref:SnoaL-like domain-containing protein n=1 Tax=Mycobacterium decipiens TaxID=1430326 RepID=A0A1X2LYF2_9MYCO|nr:nuclear transport factor 2 family protein [Mycobacterium decipiens]OSC42258.1 hypothetical protein B8W66_04560 [Mycobacterium decipiens]